MSSVYDGNDQPGPEFWDEFTRRIRNNYAGDVTLAEDCMVVKVG